MVKIVDFQLNKTTKHEILKDLNHTDFRQKTLTQAEQHFFLTLLQIGQLQLEVISTHTGMLNFASYQSSSGMSPFRECGKSNVSLAALFNELPFPVFLQGNPCGYGRSISSCHQCIVCTVIWKRDSVFSSSPAHLSGRVSDEVSCLRVH